MSDHRFCCHILSTISCGDFFFCEIDETLQYVAWDAENPPRHAPFFCLILLQNGVSLKTVGEYIAVKKFFEMTRRGVTGGGGGGI